MRIPAARRNQRGQSMVEASLVLLVCISMVLFIIDMGRALFFHEYLAERARAGARWAAGTFTTDSWNPSTSPTDVKNVVVYNSTTAGNGTGYFGLQPTNVNVSYSTTNMNNAAAVIVTISGFRTTLFIPYMAGNLNMPTMKAVATIR